MILLGTDRTKAIDTIRSHHYTHSVSSGKSYYLQFEDALVVWSMPANKNLARFLLKGPGTVWELSRLWAPDGHRANLLTQAISFGVREIKHLEHPDILVSYADPNVGHQGGVYRAASWLFHGQSERTRMYRRGDEVVSRRAFHSGPRGLTKAQIEARGWIEFYVPGKLRFVKALTRKAQQALYSY